MRKIKIILISQWPNVKNGEYELIEKIKKCNSSRYEFVVIDPLGYEVRSKKILNLFNLNNEYDFAISFHYETPKLLNLPTYLFIANPLEFMHSRGDYFSTIIPNIISYDGYLFNGSDFLESHIESIINKKINNKLFFYPSSSIDQLRNVSKKENILNKTHKLFYCGVNWEVLSDKLGRNDSLLKQLENKQLIDIYGPEKINNQKLWRGFKSYRGEIPFDGQSLINTMSQYSAVLALSSPVHLSSKTSSSRVFEALAAGVPVISDRNDHVVKLFGDSIFYIDGITDYQKTNSIEKILKFIKSNNKAVTSKTQKAQNYLKKLYVFEKSFESILNFQNKIILPNKSNKEIKISFDIFYINHDPLNQFANVSHQLSYLSNALLYTINLKNVLFNVHFVNYKKEDLVYDFPKSVKINFIDYSNNETINGKDLRLGEIIYNLIGNIKNDYFAFFYQNNFIHYDHFVKFIEKISDSKTKNNFLYISGLALRSDITSKKNQKKMESSYQRFSSYNNFETIDNNSFASYFLGSFIFSKKIVPFLQKKPAISNLSVLLPFSLMSLAKANKFEIFRSQYVTVINRYNFFSENHSLVHHTSSKGFWSQHYDLYTNFSNELNALYDINNSLEELDFINSIKVFTNIQSLNNPILYSNINFIAKVLKLFLPAFKLLRKVKRMIF